MAKLMIPEKDSKLLSSMHTCLIQKSWNPEQKWNRSTNNNNNEKSRICVWTRMSLVGASRDYLFIALGFLSEVKHGLQLE